MFNPYQPYFNNFRQEPMPQPIQNINSVPMQAQCFFVNNPKDLDRITPTPNVVYVGINNDRKEVYLRQMNNNGITEFNTYSLASGTEEKTDLNKVLEKLEQLENRMKGVRNERNNPNTSNPNVAGQTTKQSFNANIQSNDDRQKPTTTNSNTSQCS